MVSKAESEAESIAVERRSLEVLSTYSQIPLHGSDRTGPDQTRPGSPTESVGPARVRVGLRQSLRTLSARVRSGSVGPA